MKTTVEISDALFKEAKRYAAKNDLTFRQVVEIALRQAISTTAKPKKPFKLKDGSVSGNGMVKDYTWDEIRDMIYEGRGGNPVDRG
jgi:hypothetical protein